MWLPEGSIGNLLGRLSPEVVTHLDKLAPKYQISNVCMQVAPVFGFKDGSVLRSILEEAGFILTPQMVQQLLQLHARRRIREPLVFEG